MAFPHWKVSVTAFAVALVVPATAYAVATFETNPVTSRPHSFISAGAGQYGLTVASATALTVPLGAQIAEICVETAGVRYRDDGTAPTASIGIPVSAGTCFQYSGPLTAIQFIAQSGSPTVDVAYYQ